MIFLFDIVNYLYYICTIIKLNLNLMKKKGILLKSIPEEKIEYVPVNTLKELQAHVGGYIEYVANTYPMTEVIVNEEGAYMGLDHNPIVSVLLGKSVVGNIIIRTSNADVISHIEIQLKRYFDIKKLIS